MNVYLFPVYFDFIHLNQLLPIILTKNFFVYKCSFLWCLDAPYSSGPSCCLCSVTAVCLHMCKEGIRWEDTEHPGPAKKTISVCLLKICVHLCFINSLLDRRDEHSVRFIRLSQRLLACCCPVWPAHWPLDAARKCEMVCWWSDH